MKRNCHKLVLRFSLAVLLALSATILAGASGQTRDTTKRRLTARVLSVDYKMRTILVRKFDGQTMTVAVPKGLEINLSQNWPTMGRSHTVGLESTLPGMVVDVYADSDG